MPLAPKSAKDLALAPVAAEIDMNLTRLRDRPPAEIDYELALELDAPAMPNTVEERADRVLQVALRDVDLHGWHAEITPDHSAVRLTGGSVSLDIAVGASVMRFVEDPVAA